MTPFKCHLHLPHADQRLLGVRVRAVSSSGPRAAAFVWSPWHPVNDAKFGGGDIACAEGYAAPHYWKDGHPHYWSGAAPWRSEVFGGDEPGLAAEGGHATPGPGAYETPSFLTFGGGVADGRGIDYAPSSSFCSNTHRDDNAQNLWRTANPREQQPSAASAMSNPNAGYRTFSYQAAPQYTSLPRRVMQQQRPSTAKY